MSRVRYAYVTAALIDVLNAAFILCFPYIALTLDAGTAGTAANFIGAASYALWCWVFSRTRLFRERRHTIAAGCAVLALAAMVLGYWGVHSTRDFGEIVYLLIKHQWMTSQETDTIEDFDDVFDFSTVFERDYRIEIR